MKKYELTNEKVRVGIRYELTINQIPKVGGLPINEETQNQSDFSLLISGFEKLFFGKKSVNLLEIMSSTDVQRVNYTVFNHCFRNAIHMQL